MRILLFGLSSLVSSVVFLAVECRDESFSRDVNVNDGAWIACMIVLVLVILALFFGVFRCSEDNHTRRATRSVPPSAKTLYHDPNGVAMVAVPEKDYFALETARLEAEQRALAAELASVSKEA